MTKNAAPLLVAAPIPSDAKPKLQFLLHHVGDSVGVAVVDIKANTKVQGRSIAGAARSEVEALMDIPLGHKIALKDYQPGDTIVKYGVDIGKVVAPIKRGQHVHVHNLKTKRW